MKNKNKQYYFEIFLKSHFIIYYITSFLKLCLTCLLIIKLLLILAVITVSFRLVTLQRAYLLELLSG